MQPRSGSPGEKKIRNCTAGTPVIPAASRRRKRTRFARRVPRLVEDAIHGMLPKTKLGKQMYRKLKVYAGDKHPHDAQKPVALEVEAPRIKESANNVDSIFGDGPPEEAVASVFLRPARARSR
jgi:hypothetical protein